MEATQTLVRHATSGVRKSASLGGEQESGFEQAFSTLAYAYLKDKAPRLLDYIVGFQLVDRNEDNTKAMGVFGFKLGQQWLYAPVFFLNGDLKGHELLYVKNKDMFVPMKENWVNHMLAKKPHQLGERTPKDTFQLGGLAPNIEQLSWPPEQSKFGSDKQAFDVMVKQAIDRGPSLVEDWAEGIMPLLGACHTKKAKYMYRQAGVFGMLNIEKIAQDAFRAAMGQDFDLQGLIRTNVHIAKAAHDLARTYPGIKMGFDRFYGGGFFSKVATGFREEFRKEKSNLIPRRVRRKAAAVKQGKSLIPTQPQEKKAAGPPVKVITRDDVATVQNLPELTEEERKKLLNDGVLIVDRREGEEVSKAYNTQVAPQCLTNVQETGLYDVLEKPGTFEQHLVLSNPYSNRGQEPGVTTIRLADSGKMAWKNTARAALWHRHAGTRDDYQQWFDDQAEASEDGNLDKGATYVAVGERCQATVPFQVEQSYGDGCYKVSFKNHFDDGPRRPGDMSHTFYRDFNNHDGDYVSPYNAKMFVNKRNDSELRALSGELHIPSAMKFVKLKNAPKPPKNKDDSPSLVSYDSEEYDGTSSSPDPINPGDMGDIQIQLTQKTARMKLYSDHNEVIIHTEKTGHVRTSPKQALIHLVRDHGLNEKAAREMVKESQARTQVIYRVKYAYPFPFAETTGPGPNSPQFPAPEIGTENHGYRTSPSIYPQEEFISVEGLQSDLTDPKIYDPFIMPDQNAVSLAQQAGEEGQKDVFDVGMISGLLKAVRQDSLVDRYLGDLVKALDRLGRMLFMFYWHQEEFEDRYGKQDLPELEDSIRNAFETLGDVTLFLKEKTIDTGMDDIGDPDIEEAARN
jgi:hypothetical protein